MLNPDADLAYTAYMEKRINFFEIYISKLSREIDFKYELEFLLLDFLATEKRRGEQFTEAAVKEIISKSMVLDKDSFLNFIANGICKNNESGTNRVNWLNHKKLSEILAMKGFNCYKSAFGQSQYASMTEVPLFDGWLVAMS